MSQRHNDSILEIFPLRFIRKVVNKLPLNSRWNMASCSKEFYKIICHNDKFKYRISLTDKLLDDYTIYDSVMGSKRSFKELYLRDVSLSAHNLKLLTDIAGRHGSTIETLRMKFTEEFRFDGDLMVKNVQEFFVMLPNVTEWIIESSDGSRIFNNVVGDVKPVLMKVKKFKFYGKRHFNTFSSFIASNTLEDLKFNCDNELESLLQRQSNLRSIENTFKGHHFKFLKLVAFKQLKLEEIKFPNISTIVDQNLMSTLSDHAGTLVKIDLFNCSLSGAAVELICAQCVLLESVSLAVTNENVLNLLQIDNLRNLKEFGIHITSKMTHFDNLRSLTRKSLMNIEKVKLKFGDNYLGLETNVEEEKDFYTRIGLNWQNVKELEVMPSNIALNDVIKSFKNLRVVKYEHQTMSKIHRINGKIFHLVQELKLISPFSYYDDAFQCSMFLTTHLLNAFPNITTLEVANCEYRGADEFHDLLSLKQLMSLKIRFTITNPSQPVTDSDVFELKKLIMKLEKCRMKFVGEELMCETITELAEKLNGAFPFKVYERECGGNEFHMLKIKMNY